VAGRSLISVEGSVMLGSPQGALSLLPAMPSHFDTAELAAAVGCERRLAQQMDYCLRAMGVLEPQGRRGRSVLYRTASADASP
jgi:hypothetical protein